MARHYRGRSLPRCAWPAEHGSALPGSIIATLCVACRAWLGTTGFDHCHAVRGLPSLARHYRVRSLPRCAWVAEHGSALPGSIIDALCVGCRAWLGTTGSIIAALRVGCRAWLGTTGFDHCHAARGLPSMARHYPVRSLPRCAWSAEHGSALPDAEEPAFAGSSLHHRPLTCLIRRRLRLTWRSVRTFFLPSYGFTPSRKMNCTGVPTSLKRLRKKFSR